MPIARLPHVVQQVVVVHPVILEVQAQVQERLVDYAVCDQHHRYQDAPYPTVPILERMYSLELHMGVTRAQ